MNVKFEYPQELADKFKRAKKIEWITLGVLVCSAFLMFLTMGQSQTMKTAWLEDVLSLTPPISFLISSKIFLKPATKDFPFGYHRIVSIAYLCSAVALFSVGSYLLIDSLIKLIEMEHPTIGTQFFFGHQIWLGYIMIGVLVVTNIPIVILGYKRVKLAKQLHEKNLYTGSQMSKADWMSAVAAIVGITGIGLGWWWSDAAAAAIISLDILHDGFKNLKQAVLDLMDQVPKNMENTETDPLLQKVKETLEKEPWIETSWFRIREEGHIYFGEAFVVPKSEVNLVANIQNTIKKVTALSWLIYDFTIFPVDTLPDVPENN